MNVLLTSVGRRAYVVKYFKEAIGSSGEIHVCNSFDKTAAFLYADKSIVSPLIYDDSYIPFLLDYCKRNKIKVLLSLFDADLPVLSKNKEKFLGVGTQVIVSDPAIIDICNDKWKTYNYLKQNRFNVPKTYLKPEQAMLALNMGELCYPVVVKPRFGCGSIALYTAEDKDELSLFCKKGIRDIERSYLKYESESVSKKLIYQELLKGQEYGVDIINDLSGDFRNAIIKKKLAMRAGETDIAELVENEMIFFEAERLGKTIRHIANMDCDIFLVDDVPYIIEMNARLGGGYPFSHVGGCNLPQAIVNWVSNKPVPKQLLSSRTGLRIFKELVLTADT